MTALSARMSSDDPGVARALEELHFFSADVRILGAYKARPFRSEQRRQMQD